MYQRNTFMCGGIFMKKEKRKKKQQLNSILNITALKGLITYMLFAGLVDFSLSFFFSSFLSYFSFIFLLHYYYFLFCVFHFIFFRLLYLYVSELLHHPIILLFTALQLYISFINIVQYHINNVFDVVKHERIQQSRNEISKNIFLFYFTVFMRK